MLALFYYVTSNPCYPLSKNAPGIVCTSHSTEKKNEVLIFTPDHRANKSQEKRM